jgi:lipopolysaccharide export system protein LptA
VTRAIALLSLAFLLVLPACHRSAIRLALPAERPAVAEAKGNTPAAGTPEKRMQPIDEDRPVEITSDRMDYQNQGKVTVFRGRVKVNQVSTWLFTPYLEVRSDDGLALAREGIRLIDHERGLTVTAKEMDYQKNLSHVIARQDVRLRSHDQQGLPLQVRSNRLEWWSDRREALATGNVTFYYRNITATAGTMHYRQADQILVLQQDPQAPDKTLPTIKQGTDVLTGDTITIQIQKKQYEAQGHAQALIITSKDEKAKPKEKP